jgi:hypothetical protein
VHKQTQPFRSKSIQFQQTQSNSTQYSIFQQIQYFSKLSRIHQYKKWKRRRALTIDQSSCVVTIIIIVDYNTMSSTMSTTMSTSTIATTTAAAAAAPGGGGIATTTAVVQGIYTCPVGSASMIAKDTATLIEGVGLEGDRYARRVGTYSTLQEPGRQLTLISADSVRDALAGTIASTAAAGSANAIQKEKDDDEEPQPPQRLPLLPTTDGWSFDIGNLRRNIVLSGITSDVLLSAIGSVIEFGGDPPGDDTGGNKSGRDGHRPRVFVHRNCVPCMYNERKNQIPGLMNCLWETGGVSCEVIQGGMVSIGDSVTILHETDGRIVNDGGKSKSFYVRPKDRSAEMVKELLEEKKMTKGRLTKTDPEGLLRLQQSYESVGLKF